MGGLGPKNDRVEFRSSLESLPMATTVEDNRKDLLIGLGFIANIIVRV